jgi:hypothetical protein
MNGVIAPQVAIVEQHTSIALHGAPERRHAGIRPSSFPASGPPQHADDCWPQLSMQLPLHVPLGMQHWLLKQTPDEHEHEIGLPQPSSTCTLHWLPQLFLGEQQAVVDRLHSCPAGHPFDGHVIVPPQLSEMLALQRPAQVASVQHVLVLPLVVHFCPDGHAVVPFTPQLTVCVQLFWTELHWLLPHACVVDSAVHPHAPFMHAAPPAQVPQSTVLPQLSVVMPQRLSHQCGSETQMHVPSWAHPSPGAQGPVQFHMTPHESTPALQRF